MKFKYLEIGDVFYFPPGPNSFYGKWMKTHPVMDQNGLTWEAVCVGGSELNLGHFFSTEGDPSWEEVEVDLI